MVRGLDALRDHFADVSDRFVLIGGVAVQLQFESRGIDSRATKDIDMVVRMGAGDSEFVRIVWNFIEAGGYQTRQRGRDRPEYFRFLKPSDTAYPHMLELFAAPPTDIELTHSQRIVPISTSSDVRSLSAILMDDHYHALVTRHVDLLDGLPIATPFALILLKARAWLDLHERASAGARVDTKSLRKHRDDAFKLATLLVPDQRTAVHGTLRDDLHTFLDHFPPGSDAWPAIQQAARAQGLRLPQPASLAEMLRDHVTRTDA